VLFQQGGQVFYGLAVDSTNAYTTVIAPGLGTLVEGVPLNGAPDFTVYENQAWQTFPSPSTQMGELAASGSQVFLVGVANPIVNMPDDILALATNGSSNNGPVTYYGPGLKIRADATRLAYVGGAGLNLVNLTDGGTQSVSIGINDLTLHPCGVVWSGQDGVFAAPTATLGTTSAPWDIQLVGGVSPSGPVATDGESVYWVNAPPTSADGAAIGWLPLPP
jgi:hypothetical protein